MILKEYDIGWGAIWPAKQLEQKIVKSLLREREHDQSRTVIVNSVWYNGDYHQQVMVELTELRPTHVYVVAMLDPPIIDLNWFNDLQCETVGLGYFPDSQFVDYFALFVDRFHCSIDKTLLLDHTKIDIPFMCLNRKPHQHRLRLYQGLSEFDLLNKGFVSMGGNPPLRLLENDSSGQALAPNPGPEQYGIANDVASLGNVSRWLKHFINIVTETVWDTDRHCFLSEKTFKPILGLRPFLLYADNGGIKSLHSRGIEPYVHDFADISDADLTQPWNIPTFLRTLCQQPSSYFTMKFQSLQPKLLYNLDQFNNYVTKHCKL